LTKSKELIEAYQAKDKVISENVILKENLIDLNKEIVGLKLEKKNISKKVSEKESRANQIHDSSTMSSMVVSNSATGPSEST
jgi:hypothetical protein